jgi:hypothetical protein
MFESNGKLIGECNLPESAVKLITRLYIEFAKKLGYYDDDEVATIRAMDALRVHGYINLSVDQDFHVVLYITPELYNNPVVQELVVTAMKGQIQ